MATVCLHVCVVAGSNCVHWWGSRGTHYTVSYWLATDSSACRCTTDTKVVKWVVNPSSFHCRPGMIQCICSIVHFDKSFLLWTPPPTGLISWIFLPLFGLIQLVSFCFFLSHLSVLFSISCVKLSWHWSAFQCTLNLCLSYLILSFNLALIQWLYYVMWWLVVDVAPWWSNVACWSSWRCYSSWDMSGHGCHYMPWWLPHVSQPTSLYALCWHYQGHRIKVKVTRAKKREISSCHPLCDRRGAVSLQLQW